MDANERELVEPALRPLPLGEIEPREWLRRQLEIQADGLTGRLESVWPPLADNRWLGGTQGGWERGPYYADGLVPLAALLDDPALEELAEPWVEAFLDTDPDGWIGPVEPSDGVDHQRDDPWPRFVVLKVLRQHHETSGDDRALDAMCAFCRYLAAALEDDELASWARYRWGDLVESVHWLYERTGEEWLLDLAETAAEQGYDWTDHFADDHGEGFAYDRPVDPEDARMETHGVNNAMGLKAPAVRYRQSGDEGDRTAAFDGLAHLDRFHGQATGTFAADEHLAGRDPTRGTELCTVVETTYSLARLVSIHGDPTLADRLERIAYNALPAALTPDMCSHQYDQQANQVLSTVADRGWTNSPEATIFGLAPHYGCCTANLHQGWPKLTSHLWMRRDGGLATVAYAPCEVTTDVAETRVTVTEETAYPFDDEVTLRIDPERPVRFPLSLRIPAWADDASVSLPDGERRQPAPGTYHTVTREWTTGESVTLDLSARIRAERRWQGSVVLSRGPLLFALSPDETWKQIGGERPHADWEVYPDAEWNYGLAVDTDSPDASVGVSIDAPGEVPFSPEDPPVTVTVDAARVPEWRLDGPDAGPLPRSPIRVAGETEALTLVPYGCTALRVTEFPLVSSRSE